jgi:hypothetical protein
MTLQTIVLTEHKLDLIIEVDETSNEVELSELVDGGRLVMRLSFSGQALSSLLSVLYSEQARTFIRREEIGRPPNRILGSSED